MHPARSVITFSTLSGFGFGLMIYLTLGATQASGFVAFLWCAFAGIAAIAGLIASTFHLGHPERAWRAMSQWRSSWLSREGVAAIATLLAFGLYTLLWVFFDTRSPILGFICAVLALSTILCTAMIYTQLRTVPRWNTWLTPVMFLGYGLCAPGLLILSPKVSLIFLIVMIGVQIAHWLGGDKGLSARGHTPETATGLGKIGKVRLLEPPHSGENYLMKEMIFQVGRSRARQLRLITMALGLGVPIILMALALATAQLVIFMVLALICHFIGIITSRWLFFAEANHSVSLYYDGR